MPIKENLAVLGICGAIGGGVGVIAEQDTNAVSEGRITTIDTCKDIYPDTQKIGKDLLKCLEGGVPDGEPVGGSLELGQPAEFVDSLRNVQVKEAGTDDIGNVALYGLGGALFGFLFVGRNRKIRFR